MKLRTLLFSLLLLAVGFPLRAAESLSAPLSIDNIGSIPEPFRGGWYTGGRKQGEGGIYTALTFKTNDELFKFQPTTETIYATSISLGLRETDYYKTFQSITDGLSATLSGSDIINSPKTCGAIRLDGVQVNFSFHEWDPYWSMAVFKFPIPVALHPNTLYTLTFNDGKTQELALSKDNRETTIRLKKSDGSIQTGYIPLVKISYITHAPVKGKSKWTELTQDEQSRKDLILDFGDGTQGNTFTFDAPSTVTLDNLIVTGSTPVTINVADDSTAPTIAKLYADTDVSAPIEVFGTAPITIPQGKTFTVQGANKERELPCDINGPGTLVVEKGGLFAVPPEKHLNVAEIIVREGGGFRFNGGDHTHNTHITVEKDAYVRLSDGYRTILNSGVSVTLNGSSSFILHNESNTGDDSNKVSSEAALFIAETATQENPAHLINNTQHRDDTLQAGPISGPGTLHISKGGLAESNPNERFTLSGSVSGLANLIFDNCTASMTDSYSGTGRLVTRNARVKLTGANSYSGQTAILGNSTVTINYVSTQFGGEDTVFLDEPATLVVSPVVTDFSTERLRGKGTLRLTFQTFEENKWEEITANIPNFEGITEMQGGCFTINNSTHIGRCLRILDKGQLQTTVDGGLTFSSTLEIAGYVQLHCNENKPLTLTGDLIGTSATAKLDKKGKALLKISNAVCRIKNIQFNDWNKAGHVGISIEEGATFVTRNLTTYRGDVIGTDTYSFPSLTIQNGGTLQVVSGASYGGAGPLTFESDAILDVSAGAKLTAKSVHPDLAVAVTLPQEANALTVKIPAGVHYPLTLIEGKMAPITTPIPCTVVLGDSVQKEGYSLISDGTALKLDVAGLPKPNGNKDDGTLYSDKAKGVLMNANQGLLPGKVTAEVNGPDKSKTKLDAAGVSNVITMLDGVVTKSRPAAGAADANEVVLNYNFGIAGITVVKLEGKDYVVLKAKADSGTADSRPVSYAFNTLIRVFRDATKDSPGEEMKDVVEVTDMTGKTPGSASEGIRCLRFPMTDALTHRYTVAMANGATFKSNGTVTPPASGKKFTTTTFGTDSDFTAEIARLEPTDGPQRLALKVAGGGTFEGQVYEVRDANGNLLGSGTLKNGSVVIDGMNLPQGKTTIVVKARNCLGDITVKDTTWDVQWTNDTRTVPAQGMIAVHPKHDFKNESWSDNITGSDAVDAPDNAKHSQYRIPGVASNGKGEVIAVYDIRWLSQDDLGVATNTPKGTWSPMDMGESYSSTEGTSWEKPKIGINVPNVYDPETGAANSADVKYDFGDPCIVYYPGDKDKGYEEAYFVMGITGGGLAGHGGVGNSNPTNGLALYKRPVGRGAAWKPVTSPMSDGTPDNTTFETQVLEALFEAGAHLGDNALKDCKNYLELKQLTRGVLQGPGHGLVTTKQCGEVPPGAIVFPMQWFYDYDKWWYESDYEWAKKSYAFALYSTDGGKTWKATQFVTRPKTGAAIPEDLGTQESSVTQLDDGSLYLIAKHVNGGRYCYRSTDLKTWTYLDTLPSNAVQGSILRIGADRDGYSWYAMAYSTGPNRSQLKIFFGRDNTPRASKTPGSTPSGFELTPIVWFTDSPLMIHEDGTGGKSYNSMCLLDGGKTLGILYEANMHIYFKRIDISRNVQLE